MELVRSRYSTGNRGRVRPSLTVLCLLGLLRAVSASGDQLTADTAAAASPAAVAGSALQAAQIAIDQALAAGNLWLGTQPVLSRALAANDTGDFTRAATLAEVARRQARMALNQARLERARYLLSTLAVDGDVDALAAVRGLLRAYDGDAALRLLRELSGN
jgi:hypothetical protein